jgi:maltose alpha-D-glucosyltransferase/alpha-amylase
MLAVRKTSQAFGRGSRDFLKPGNRKILAYLRECADDTILCVANLSRTAQPVELNLSAYKGRIPVEMLGRTAFPPIGELPYLLTISAYGFYWFRLTTDAEVPSWHAEIISIDERPVLVLFDGWSSLFRDRVVPWRIGLAEKARQQFETETMPRFIETQRWYAAKGRSILRARMSEQVLWTEGKLSWLLALLDLDVEGEGEPTSYFVPLALAWEDRDDERLRNLTGAAAAKVRQQGNVGVIGDAFADEVFCRAIVGAIAARREIASGQGKLSFRPTDAFAEIAGGDFAALKTERPQGSSSNTIVTMGERLMLKGYRRLRGGISPELEMGLYLTEAVHYPNCARLAGVVDYTVGGGPPRPLALLQAYVANQGDGWSYATDYLQRHLEVNRTAPAAETPPVNAHDAHIALIRVLATRTAELHRALATPTRNPDFNPEPMSAADIEGYRQRARGEVRDTLALLSANLEQLSTPDRTKAATVLAQSPAILAQIDAIAPGTPRARKIRVHGDYHLGQVLLTRNDFVIIDFEGEPGRGLEQRRAKQSSLRDVSGMLRSFSYVQLSAVRQFAHDESQFAKLGLLARAWELEARAAFLAAYDEAARGSELYESLDPRSGLLGLFEIEKAFYELRYELGNRPSWAGIPLQGILEWGEAHAKL